MELKRGTTVRVKNLDHLITDRSIDPILKGTRRKHMIGTVDSPIYLTFNHHWLVKHITSRMYRGISFGKYGIYHEKELEVIELPKASTEPEADSPIGRGTLDYDTRWEDE